MPWEVSDVDSHKKGLTPAQKKKWVQIANAILKDCQAKKGKDCEGKAVRIANSKFSMEGFTMTTEKIPKGALRFVDDQCQAFAEEVEVEGKKIPRLRMTGYSGKIIKDHFWWGDLAIDLSGIKFKGSKFPILENHNTNSKIAFHKGKPVIDKDGLHVDPEKTQFVSTEESAEFQKLSQEGFPFQSSIYAIPEKIIRLMEDEEREVNGYKMKGPRATIWLECEFKEMSVCVFGWDSQTQASAFSKEVTEEITFEEGGGESITLKEVELLKTLELEGGEREMPFDIEKFKVENPEGYEAMVKIGVSEAEMKFAKDKDKMSTIITEQATLLQGQGEKIVKLEKNDAIRRENELRDQAKDVFTEKLSESDIPQRLWDKVRAQVVYDKFVTNDQLDTEKFVQAVEAEIKDWEGKGVKSSVLGTGSFGRDIDTSEDKKKLALVEENKGLVNNLLKLAGQKVA